MFSSELFEKAYNFIKKEILAQAFFREFCEISKNAIFTENLRKTTSISFKLKLLHHLSIKKH